MSELITQLNLGTRPGFHTSAHLRKAEEQATARNYQDILIVDVDAHHYEQESYTDIFSYIEDPVMRHLALSDRSGRGSALLYRSAQNQSNAGRVVRYAQREQEEREGTEHRDVTRARRQREAIGIDYQIIFPTPMLQLGMHPDPRVEKELAWAYSRWWTEEVLPHDPRMKTMIYLPFHDPDACLRMIEEFSERRGVVGFMVTATRYSAIHGNEYMPVYAALEERGLPLGFHASFHQQERIFEGMNRFLSVHAVGFVLNNLIHATNLVVNGIPERFPKLKFIMIESGLAWIPFLMQRLDNEYMMRTNEAPLLTRKPSEYLASSFYYTTQPMEMDNMAALELTMSMINADSQLMFASDYPHWDFNLPSTVYDLPFLSHETKLNILGRNAQKVFPALTDA